MRDAATIINTTILTYMVLLGFPHRVSLGSCDVFFHDHGECVLSFTL